jgi:hypothetical protein
MIRPPRSDSRGSRSHAPSLSRGHSLDNLIGLERTHASKITAVEEYVHGERILLETPDIPHISAQAAAPDSVPSGSLIGVEVQASAATPFEFTHPSKITLQKYYLRRG